MAESLFSSRQKFLESEKRKAASSKFTLRMVFSDSLFLVDVKDENLDNLETGLCNNRAKLMEEALAAAEDLAVPGHKNIKVEASSMNFLPLYRDDSECCLLVLTDPQDKNTGNLCGGHTSQCYMLPVLDTMFVRKKFRRHGLGMKMLQDFCQSFPSEEALGLSCPLSAEMEKVCQKFLETYPKQQPRLWEVEAPGDWTQRVNIWLKIQLGPNADRSSPMPKGQDGEAEDGRINTSPGCIPHLGAPPDQPTAHLGDRRGVPGLPSQSDELQVQLKAEEAKKLKKRTSREEPAEDSVAKHLRTMS
ncbi:uncharacterized protein LOC131184546 isoform X6 [Ahaetulla prasina]|uniref:uncharacterized protein LOC131184546 isoform X6 n=1 Tax=Ahaetulla prasina TaxID=499056 RepID=UPI0026473494|nr:uncharacterized protein LOC131184546 isoform X6 [Ahaetulla prasina]